MRPRIPLAEPVVSQQDLESVCRCLHSGWVSTAGSFIGEFERLLATKLGVEPEQVVATISGTAALHMALRLLNVGTGQMVLLPTLTFAATANAVSYVGATPAFLDVNAHGAIDAQSVRQFMEFQCRVKDGNWYHRSTGAQVSAMIVVHPLGHPAAMDGLVALAADYRIALVEDAAGALGARYDGRPVGTFGDVAALSFNGNKIITAGGGGAIVARVQSMADEARHLITQARKDSINQIHDKVGFNYRITNLHAALGHSQLLRLEAAIDAKRNIAEGYRRELEHIPGVTTVVEPEGGFGTYWLFTIRIDKQGFGCSAPKVLEELSLCGMEARRLWQPLHRSPAFQPSVHGRTSLAETLYHECVSLPCSVALQKEAQREVLAAILKVYRDQRCPT